MRVYKVGVERIHALDGVSRTGLNSFLGLPTDAGMSSVARSGYAGDSFGDRLMNIDAGALASLDGLWWAHKVRNRLAHEMDYFLRYTEARQAMGYYEQTLQELNLV